MRFVNDTFLVPPIFKCDTQSIHLAELSLRARSGPLLILVASPLTPSTGRRFTEALNRWCLRVSSGKGQVGLSCTRAIRRTGRGAAREQLPIDGK